MQYHRARIVVRRKNSFSIHEFFLSFRAAQLSSSANEAARGAVFNNDA
jgi:hypothetical protein